MDAADATGRGVDETLAWVAGLPYEWQLAELLRLCSTQPGLYVKLKARLAECRPGRVAE